MKLNKQQRLVVLIGVISFIIFTVIVPQGGYGQNGNFVVHEWVPIWGIYSPVILEIVAMIWLSILVSTIGLVVYMQDTE